MWPSTFEQRLAAWHRLRLQAAASDLAGALLAINQWWWRAPWCAVSVSWQDQAEWPDPWALLSRHRLCDLARALGMSYTVIMLPDIDLENSWLMELGGRDVVSVSAERYIMNWGTDLVADMPATQSDPSRRVSLSQLKSTLN